MTRQGRGIGAGRRAELDAGLERLPNGEKALQVRDCLPHDAAAHRLTPESSLLAPPDDPNSTTSLE
jgi:hypothetical protein